MAARPSGSTPALAATLATVSPVTRQKVSRYQACSRWNQRVEPRSWRLASRRCFYAPGGPARLDRQPGSTPFRAEHVRRSTSITFNIASYGHLLMSDFLAAGGKIVKREFHEPSELGRRYGGGTAGEADVVRP